MADTTSPPLLRLEGISKRYGATLALNNVRFDLFGRRGPCPDGGKRRGQIHADEDPLR
ncbi:ribose ABC transport system [Klebsiella michiganensis]|uniref:Ribose ABC transport system n=1 Tax=Klebsiella michiganensis TaxID=1134687 RepID=A0A7H4MZ19_9ENTR|nr:ribose ABC transport system [Klebsiella michiganensis]